MTTTRVDISMSVDGFIAGPGISPEHVLGIGGEAVHGWLSDDDAGAVLERSGDGVGAIICGRVTFDLSLQYWGAHGPSGPDRRVPVIVLSHSAPEHLPVGSVYHLDQGHPADVLERAGALAAGGTVAIMGGAATINQFLTANLVDEIHLHLAPVLLGRGLRLFDLPAPISLEHQQVAPTPSAIHAIYHLQR